MQTANALGFSKTKKLTTMAGFAAISCVLMVVARFPVLSFLTYEPKDVIIAFAGFIFGPLAVLALSLVVSFIEMVAVSNTGPIGFLMNVLSTVSFAGVAAYVYKKHKTLGGAVFGLILGVLVSTAVMLLWNYIITPVYLGVPRDVVVGMLLPTILPFNLIKGGLNATLTLMLYKPAIRALRSARLVPEREELAGSKYTSLWVYVVSGAVLVTCVLLVLSFQGVI